MTEQNLRPPNVVGRLTEQYRRTWGGLVFTDRELRQIVALEEWWAGGPVQPLQLCQHRLTQNVRRWALSVGLLIWKCGCGATYGYRYPDACATCGRRSWRLISRERSTYEPVECLPPAALWDLVWRHLLHEPSREGGYVPCLAGQSYGFSVTTRRGWAVLNVEWQEQPFHVTAYMVEQQYDYEMIAYCRQVHERYQARQRVLKERVFQRLAAAGYLLLQTCGDVWQITLLVAPK